MTNTAQHTATQVALNKLKDHPAQAATFEACSAAEDEAFKQDLKTQGQRDPIHVMPPDNRAMLPAYTVLDGHRRARALRALGKTHADVIVRHDLQSASPIEVEQVFLQFNLQRRQLHPLDRAALLVRLFELEKGKPAGWLRRQHARQQGAARDRVAVHLDLSGRHAQRLWNIVLGPKEIRDAVRDELLATVLADKATRLPEQTQAELLDELRPLLVQAAKAVDGSRADHRKTIEALIKRYVPAPVRKMRKAKVILGSLARALRQAQNDLEGRAGKLKPWVVEPYFPAINAGLAFLQTLADRCTDASSAAASHEKPRHHAASVSALGQAATAPMRPKTATTRVDTMSTHA